MRYLLIATSLLLFSCSKKILHLEVNAFTNTYPQFEIADSLLNIEVELIIPNSETDKIKGIIRVTNPNDSDVEWLWKSTVIIVNGEVLSPDIAGSNLISYTPNFDIPAHTSERYKLQWQLPKREKIREVDLP